MLMEQLVRLGHCAYCKTSVRPVLESGPHGKTGARFCPNCGAQIWTVCTCGANLRYEDRQCSACGRANPIFLGNDPAYLADKVEG